MDLKAEQDAMRRRVFDRRQQKEPKVVSKKERRKWQTYFIQGRMTEFIKIGKSLDPKRRLACLKIGSPDELVLLAVIDGNHEKSLHKRFAADRHHGEWFFSPTILRYLKEKFHQFIQ